MTITEIKGRLAAPEVHSRLADHMLVDTKPYVLDLARSHGPYLYDALGKRELLDLFMCFSTCPLGYNHPGVTDPDFAQSILPAALNKPSNSDFHTVEMAEFVEAFARIVPDSHAHHMFFIEGGALAVENALKAAFDWKVRKNQAAGKGEKGHRVIHLRRAFHGRSGYTMSLTNTDPKKTAFFPQFDWPRITNPALSFPVNRDVLERVERQEAESIQQVKDALVTYPDEIAALILEPIQGEGGDNHFRPEYLGALRQLADESEFLLIFDEIQTGFGTTGTWWSFEQLGVAPDIFAFGKKTQVCGICASSRLDDVDSVFKVSSRINSTWGGNLVDMIRCRRYIEIIEQEDLLTNAATVGRHLLAGLEAIANKMPELVSNARGRGMFLAIDMPDIDVREAAVQAMREGGVLGMRSGDRSIRFRPPLNLTTGQAEEGLTTLESVFKTMA
ncbi:MAG: L-lysine 6-transaminase [Acidobacteriota bacterium]|nr:L-lysine 6-transaminase [Acidobacteriota bacterium]